MRFLRASRIFGLSFMFTLCASHGQSAPPGPAAAYADPLTRNGARATGAVLNKTEVAEGNVKWSADKGVTIGENGATPAGPSGAHIAIPLIAGTIRVQADVFPKGTPFVALALGRGNLSGNFWESLGVMVTVTADGRYDVFAAKKSLVAQPNKTLLKTGVANHVEMDLNTTARTVTVLINGQKAVDALPLPKEAQLDALTAAGFRFQEPVTPAQAYVSNFRVDLVSTSVAGLTPVDYSMSFVVPNQPTTLRWRAASAGPVKPIPYTVADYSGRRLETGEAKLEGAELRLTRTFPRGYAEISFPEANQTFGVVSLDPHTGSTDPFFCIDASLTWLESDPARREGLVKIMARTGISMARERFDSVFTNTPGEYKWDTSRGMESVRKLYADSHVQVLDILGRGDKMFGMVAGQRYPQNLSMVASQWAGVARHWENIWGGAEVYNEPDLTTSPADQYAPMAKAFSYALSEAKSNTPLVTGVAATAPPGPWFETLAANGLLADSDVFSFHSYDRPTDIESMVVRYRAWLKKAGREGLTLWQTECGKSWTKGPSRPPVEQDALSAAEIAAMGIETKACGVARYFPFVLTYYEEGLKNFGMLGREATPLRSMAAYAQSALALAGQPYLGDLTMNDATVKLARVFGKDRTAVVTLYTGLQDPKATVGLPVAFQRIAGADGRELMPVDGKVPVPDGLSYVWVKVADLGAALKTNTQATELTRIGRTPAPSARLASPVILQFLAQDMPAQVSARRYLVTQELAHELPIQVRVHNLSAQPLDVTPELTLPGGGPEQKSPVSVPARGYVDVDWKLDATKALDIAQTRFITITAKSSGDKQPSPLALPFTMEGTLEQHLARHASQTPLPITDLTKWQPNMGSGKSHFSATPEGLWRVDLSFAATQGNWAYPRFVLPQKLDPSVQRGFLLRIRTIKPGRPAIIAKAALGKGVSFWVPEIFPGEGEWHVVYIPFTEFVPGPGGAGDQNTRLDPASWKYLEIGMGSNTQENALEISHFLVVGGPER